MSKQPNPTRREFQVASGSLLLGGSSVMALGAQETHANDKQADESGTGVCDFQASFMTWDFAYRKDPRPNARHNIPHGNFARIQLESLIDVIDRESGDAQRYVLIAPCRSEWVYAENRLFQIPNREYRNIYSLTEERGMGQKLTWSGEVARGHAVTDDFRSLKIDFASYSHSTLLETAADIVAATAANRQLVARTRISDPDRPLDYVLEYPIRTMNFQPKTNSFQVDTGPLLVPDFKSQQERAIDRLEMAYVAYNRMDRAEFILRRPTPVPGEKGETLCHVLHYAEVREDTAVNELFASA